MRSRLYRGFTLIELLVVIAVIALLISILLPALAGARRTARQTVCIANLQQFGRAYASYANDFKETISAFQGEINDSASLERHTEHGVIASQARYIINTFDGARLSPIKEFVTNQTIHSSASVAEQYEHLALIGYVSEDVRMKAAVCPEDRPRLEWQSRPNDPTSWIYQPQRSINRSNAEWLVYSSSYQLTPASAAYSFSLWNGGSEWIAYEQSTLHNLYQLHKVSFGGRKMSHVAYPSGKVAMMDSQQRHFGKDLFYAYPRAQQPLLFWDGSVTLRITNNANVGWRPRLPETEEATKMTYYPDLGFESPTDGDPNQKLWGYYRWTRSGLHGIDYGGAETKGTVGETRLRFF